MMRGRFLATTAVSAVLIAVTSVAACKLPVFRFALERWPADRYRVVAIVEGEPQKPVAQALAELDRLRESNANVDVESIDLAKLTDEQLWQVEGLEHVTETPCLQVFFPSRDGQRRVCWTGPLTAESILRWRDSSLRRQIAEDLIQGVSAVWVLVEGNDAERNDRLAEKLRSALDQAAKEIEIPDGVIPRDQAASYLQQNPSASMDDVLRSDIPLKIEFSLRRLKADDPSETAIRAMIGGWERGGPARGGSKEVAGPFVFPVFGRGRMIEPLSGDQFTASSIVAACHYLVGECNCTVKALNPGVDLILDADWKQHLDDSVLIIDRPLPTSAEFVAIPAGDQRVAGERVDDYQQVNEGEFNAAQTTTLAAADSEPTRRGLALAAVVFTVIAVVGVGRWLAARRE